MKFYPDTVYFENNADEYPLGIHLYETFKEMNIPIRKVKNYTPTVLSEKNPSKFYLASKRTLVVGIRKSMKLDVCKPSADYEFSLVSGCPGSCEYCYLQTNQALKPFTRVYVNVDEILANISKYIGDMKPRVTTFEAASLGDPIAVEHLTGSVKKSIEFFSKEEFGRLRLVTKFANIDSLTQVEHNKHTKIRFSLNSNYVVKNFEHKADSIEERVLAAGKLYDAGYPIGFIIAPIMYYEEWVHEYSSLFNKLRENINNPDSANITFELIQYRFTLKSKKTIMERFPNTKLQLNEDERIKKWGPFGNYKYVYPRDKQMEMKDFLFNKIKECFPMAEIEYFT